MSHVMMMIMVNFFSCRHLTLSLLEQNYSGTAMVVYLSLFLHLAYNLSRNRIGITVG